MRPQRNTATSLRPRVVRTLFGLVVAASLVSGIAGGLVRVGLTPGTATAAWLSQAVVAHAFLMVCSFLGTLIGIERAVAVKKAWTYLAPVASGFAGLATLAGQPRAAAWLALVAAVAFVFVNVVVVSRQRASHTMLLLLAALTWLGGSLLHAFEVLSGAIVPLWLAFLVITIAAERLEMTRLMRRRPGASAVLCAALAVTLGGGVVSAFSGWGSVIYGSGLLGLSLWLFTFDIARRTVAAHGLSRYMAICLLSGYGWLGVSGLAWAATSVGLPFRDAALHALALGFVFSMIFGHAPVILPAIARVKLHFTWAFYVPLVVLHASLAVRLFLPHIDQGLMRVGSIANAAAIGLFAVTVVGSSFAWRMKHTSTNHHHGHAVRH